MFACSGRKAARRSTRSSERRAAFSRSSSAYENRTPAEGREETGRRNRPRPARNYGCPRIRSDHEDISNHLQRSLLEQRQLVSDPQGDRYKVGAHVLGRSVVIARLRVESVRGLSAPCREADAPIRAESVRTGYDRWLIRIHRSRRTCISKPAPGRGANIAGA